MKKKQQQQQKTTLIEVYARNFSGEQWERFAVRAEVYAVYIGGNLSATNDQNNADVWDKYPLKEIQRKKKR
jgi:hypothetical protein